MSELDLRETLKLERLEVNLFRGVSPASRVRRIYGGQVIAQALLAADAIDEVRLVVAPAIAGRGRRLLRPADP